MYVYIQREVLQNRMICYKQYTFCDMRFWNSIQYPPMYAYANWYVGICINNTYAHCTLHIVQSTVYNVQCRVCIDYCKMCNVQCTRNKYMRYNCFKSKTNELNILIDCHIGKTIWFRCNQMCLLQSAYTPYNVHYTVYTLQYPLYTVLCTLYTLHYSLYTVYWVYVVFISHCWQLRRYIITCVLDYSICCCVTLIHINLRLRVVT